MQLNLSTIKNVYKSEIVEIETLELKGYKLIKEYFVDSSQLGLEYEPALTKCQFDKELEIDLKKINKTVYSFIINEGQFQVYLGLFSKSKTENKTIARNTLEIKTKDGFKIRLYNTNIIEKTKDGYILNSGGFQTDTTKSRINDNLPIGYKVFQKDYDWFIQTPQKIVEFKDNILIKI